MQAQPDDRSLERRVADLERLLATVTNELRQTQTRQSLAIPRSVIAPTASEVTRGRIFLTEGAAGVADTVKIVVKDAADAYVLTTIV